MINGLSTEGLSQARDAFMTLIRNFSAASALLLVLAAAPVAAQINLPSLGDSLSSTLSSQQEYEFGREFLRSIHRDTRPLSDPLMEEYIANVSYRLAVNSELSNLRLHFVLIDSPVLNAFAAPGGILGVNAGLFQYAQNEGQFASVIAHELAHISQRHYARRLEQARQSTLPNLAAMLASLVVAATVGGDAGQAAMMTAQARAVNDQLRFSRSNEEEADRVGIRTLYNAGFNPNDMPSMFQNMLRDRSFSQRPPEFLSTHPLDENRIADSRNRAANYPPVEHVPDPEYLLMRHRVQVHYSDNLDSLISQWQRALPQLNGQDAAAARYGIALAQLRSGQAVTATETLAPLLEKEPRRITYVVLEAEIAREAGDHARALDILEDHLRINPGNHPLTMTYVRTLELAGQAAKAAQVLESHSSKRPDDLNLWYQLAELQGLAGNIGKVHLARAEYYLGMGEFGRAREQLNFALNLEKDSLGRQRINQRLQDIQDIQNRFYR